VIEAVESFHPMSREIGDDRPVPGSDSATGTGELYSASRAVFYIMRAI